MGLLNKTIFKKSNNVRLSVFKCFLVCKLILGMALSLTDTYPDSQTGLAPLKLLATLPGTPWIKSGHHHHLCPCIYYFWFQ